MSVCQLGSRVKVHYTGTLEDGTIFDSTKERESFDLTLGDNRTVPGFEMGIVGMVVGEIRTFEVSPEVGFGPRNDDYREEIKRSAFPAEIKLEVGKQLKVPHVDGSFFRATIKEFNDDVIILDTNHPLAGKKLTFEVELLEILER